MRRVKQEITDHAVFEEILKLSRVCRIGFTDAGHPYIVPMNFGYKDGCLYMHTGAVGKKMDLLLAHPEVGFEVEQMAEIVRADKACLWDMTYRSVIGSGTLEIISDDEGKRDGLKILMAHQGAPDMLDFEDGAMKALVVLRLRIDAWTAKKSIYWDK